jgi:hypothetical protein
LHQIFQACFKQFRCTVVERKKWLLHMRQLISQHGSFRWYNPSAQRARSKKYMNPKNVQSDYFQTLLLYLRRRHKILCILNHQSPKTEYLNMNEIWQFERRRFKSQKI